MKDISVIVPVYNGERMLECCIRSISNAGRHISEIIIVDDGSTDNTLQTAENLSRLDKRIKVVHTENHGIYMARIAGIRHATAPYIALADVDDKYCEGALDLLTELLIINDADISFGSYIEVTSLENIPKLNTKSVVKLLSQNEMWPRIMKWKTQEFASYVWNKVYKRELFSELIMVDGLCQGEDVLFTCQVFLRAKKIVETNQVVYFYYQNPKSILHASFGDRDLDLITVWDNIIAIMSDHNKRLKYWAQYNRWRTDFTLACRLILANDREADRKYEGLMNNCRESLRLHWWDLIYPQAMPLNRQLIILGLRFAFTPTKSLLRFLGKIHKN